ncbi:MAG: FCSD flavin-binding domain-containing protein [Betaproteobacteria bacterium]
MKNVTRRELLKAYGALAAVGTLGGCAGMSAGAGPRVVVIGGGYGGATCAKYIRKWSEGRVSVTLVERNDKFISCPLSNLVIGGSKELSDITVGYENLAARHGVTVMRDEALTIDPQQRTVKLASGVLLGYDKLVVAPGVDMNYESIPGLDNAAAQAKILHAWKAGEQTVALHRQLAAMPDGGVFAIFIPKAPYRCPPGPYERACQVAWYMQQRKPKSKVLILDANEDIQSKKGLFTAVWNAQYKGFVEYRPNSTLLDVDLATMTAKLEFEDVKAAVLNVIPPQRAGAIARELGMANANSRFCQVDFRNFESTAQPNIHVLGDAIQPAPAMPKSGHMANQHGKVAANAIVAMLTGQPYPQEPVIANTCYSFIDDKRVVHVSSVHRYVPEHKTMEPVPGSGGLSSAPSEVEGQYAFAWARNIWADMLG